MHYSKICGSILLQYHFLLGSKCWQTCKYSSSKFLLSSLEFIFTAFWLNGCGYLRYQKRSLKCFPKICTIFISRILLFKICIRVTKSSVAFDCNLYSAISVFIHSENFSSAFTWQSAQITWWTKCQRPHKGCGYVYSQRFVCKQHWQACQ